MPRWLYEAGIGENRAILIEDGAVAEAVIERPAFWLRAGSVVDARLDEILIPRRRGIVSAPGESRALLEPIPAKLTQGATVRVEIIREAIWELGLMKPAKVRPSDADLREGPTLFERLSKSGYPVKRATLIEADAFESWGWSELLEEAESGEIAFDGGALRMSLTPAMTLFDVDGFLSPSELAIAGARAAGRTIRRFGIGGSIGIDLPTLSSRADRQAAAAALDEVLPQPFERTAVNGFGFLQVVRKRERMSLPEALQYDPIGAAARALLRRAERAGGSGERTIRAAPEVISFIRQGWLDDELAKRIGASVALQPDAACAISAGHVQSLNP